MSDFLFEGAVREWRPLDISNPKELLLPSRKANRLGVRIGRRRFHSEHRPGSSGIQLPDLPAYVPWPNPQNTPLARARRAEARYRAEIEYTQDMALWQRWAESEGLIDEDDEPPLSWKQQQRHQRRQLAAVRAAQARPQPCPW
ncbi:MAG: hypothetical protein C0480_04225 [Bradyrhizobium sp.]|nr:hypothetical protein [Bradyrhizobium sp.]